MSLEDKCREAIRRALKPKGKTRAGLGEAVGVDGVQMTQLLLGKRDLKVREIPKMEKYLGIRLLNFAGTPLEETSFNEKAAMSLVAQALQAAQVDDDVATETAEAAVLFIRRPAYRSLSDDQKQHILREVIASHLSTSRP